MFDWLKRRASAPAVKKAASTPATAPARKPAATPPRPQDPPSRPAPLPEVVAEGNTEADWSAWEDSRAALDSQLQSILPAQEIYVRDTRPTQLEEPDAFSGVRRKRDL